MKPLLLVVENDASTRRLLDISLRRESFEVDAVATGTDALTLLGRVDYAAVVLDLLMPGRTGRDVLEDLAAHHPALLERIVVVTSATEAHLRDVRGRFPQVAVLRKPFDLDELIAGVRQRIAGAAPREPDVRQDFVRRSVMAGAKSGVVARSGDDGLELLDSFGYPPGLAESFFPIRTDAQYPLAVAVRHGRAVWLSALNDVAAASEYPLLVSIWRERRSYALAAVPVFDGERVAGVAGWSFAEPRVFHPREQAVLSSIAAAAVPLVRSAAAAQRGT
jgi:CheY-like chemotaxis protein